MRNKIKPIAAICILASLMFLSGCLKEKTFNYKINLEMWGTFDSGDVYGKYFSSYGEVNPFMGDIKYRKLDVDNYKKDLIDALASGNGPDIFFIRNSWLPSFKDKIEPAPVGIFGEQEFRRDFVDVVASDFLDEGKVYAVPLSVDSLALYYNKDLFNAEGITSPPSTWEDLQEDVRRLTKIDQFGNVTQQGIAMGTAYNINRSTDILSLIMLQRGAQMTDEGNFTAAFDNPIMVNGNSFEPGRSALEFYTSFAKSDLPIYSWNPRLHYSIDSFYEGTAAMMLNYSWQYATIKSKNSKLNFAITTVPQFAGSQPTSPPASPNQGESPGGPVNYANYWGLAVAKNKTINSPTDVKNTGETAPDNKTRILESWELIRYLTAKNNGKMTLYNGISGTSKEFPVSIDPALDYLKETARPAARRDIIETQKTDPILGPFAQGNLIAKSWYQADPEAIETLLAEAIDSVGNGLTSPRDALKLAANRVSQLMRK